MDTLRLIEYFAVNLLNNLLSCFFKKLWNAAYTVVYQRATHAQANAAFATIDTD